jgi:hypothetical protein
MTLFFGEIRFPALGLMCVSVLGAGLTVAWAADYPADFITEPKYFRGLEIAADLELREYYDTNVQLQAKNTKSDFVTVVRPSLALIKQWGRHEFQLDGNAGVRRFAENHNENVETGAVGFSGKLEALRKLQFPFSVRYSKETQERINRNPGSLTIKPQDLNRLVTEAGLVYQPNRLKVELIGTYEQFRAKDAELPDGTIAFGKERYTNNAQGVAKFSYAFGTGWTPHVKLTYQNNDDIYPTLTSTGYNGLERDNRVYEAQAGFDLDYKNLVLGGFDVGYEIRDYNSQEIQSVAAVSLDADLKYNITPRTTLGLVASRATYEDNLILASYVETGARASLNHALTSRLYLNTSASYKMTEFEELKRNDDEYSGQLGLAYLVDKGLALEGGYSYQTRDSTVDVLSYDHSVVFVGLKKRF